MKKIITIALLYFSLAISTAYAHPPSDIKITFDLPTKMLRAVITHNVSNPSSHHIKEVDVFLNDKEIIKQLISVQDNHTNQTVTYHIPGVEEGDTIAVQASCNFFGSLQKNIVVKK